MDKFRFGKKKGDDDDPNRSSLFGSRTKSKSTTPSNSNPYAAPPPSDPYASPPPPPYAGGSQDSFRRDNKSPAVTGPGGSYSGYGGQPGAGQAGYGQSPYGGQAAAPPVQRRPGGYGGLGDSVNTDEARDQLFGAAPQRYQQQPQRVPAAGQYGGYGGAASAPGAPGAVGGYGGPGGAAGAGGAPGGYDSGASSGYGAYGDRELTQEEQEEEDINATKQEMKFIRQQDVSSTRNALRLAQQAEETGRSTLDRLAGQGERIFNAEQNLDRASTQNRIAEEKARELKTLNKSMFAVHVGNPFTSASRREARDAQLMDTHRREREERDATRKNAWESRDRAQQVDRDLYGNPVQKPASKSTLAERANYTFEEDEQDEKDEDEINENLDQLHGAATRLKGLGMALGEEVDTQNRHIKRIIGKTDKVDDQIAMNRARLDRIH